MSSSGSVRATVQSCLHSAVVALYRGGGCGRVVDPDRKGAIESTIKHTQNTVLKGLKFNCIEDQNAWLAHWEERWATGRIDGRKRRHVIQLFLEETPHLQPPPLQGFRFFTQETRTVDDAGLVRWSALTTPPCRHRCTRRSSSANTGARSRSSISAGSSRADSTCRSRRVTSRSLQRTHLQPLP